MNSVWNRLNAIFMLMTLNGIFITMVTQTTTRFFHDTSPTVRALDLTKVLRLRQERGRDRAVLLFDYDIDLTPVFDWNCKQVFLFVEASYQVPGLPINRVVIWDQVIHGKEDAVLVAKNVVAEYELEDVHDQLRGSNVSLRFGWDTMPHVGLVGKYSQLKYSEPSSSLAMPESLGRWA